MPGTLRMQVSDSSPCPPLGLQVPERIDYVLSTMRPLASSVALQRIGGRGSGAGSGATAEGGSGATAEGSGMSYSDHFAVKVGQHTAGGGGQAGSGAAAARNNVSSPPFTRERGRGLPLHPLSPGTGAPAL